MAFIQYYNNESATRWMEIIVYSNKGWRGSCWSAKGRKIVLFTCTQIGNWNYSIQISISRFEWKMNMVKANNCCENIKIYLTNKNIASFCALCLTLSHSLTLSLPLFSYSVTIFFFFAILLYIYVCIQTNMHSISMENSQIL